MLLHLFLPIEQRFTTDLQQTLLLAHSKQMPCMSLKCSSALLSTPNTPPKSSLWPTAQGTTHKLLSSPQKGKFLVISSPWMITIECKVADPWFQVLWYSSKYSKWIITHITMFCITSCTTPSNPYVCPDFAQRRSSTTGLVRVREGRGRAGISSVPKSLEWQGLGVSQHYHVMKN